MTQKEILESVDGGADIYDLSLAIELRKLEKKGLVTVTRAMGAPENGAEQQPYFGCILSSKGRTTLTRQINGQPNKEK